MAAFSKDFMAILLVITIIISVFGTLTAMYSMLDYKKVQEAPYENTAQAKVSVNLVGDGDTVSVPEPVSVTGKVFVNVLPEEGG